MPVPGLEFQAEPLLGRYFLHIAGPAPARSYCEIATQEEIYRALRRGDLEVRARRNGTGDMEKIASEQWLSLKFQSWNGHDLAVPINVEQDVLKLPKAFDDYISGAVPADILPAVWPDPYFAAEQVKKDLALC